MREGSSCRLPGKLGTMSKKKNDPKPAIETDYPNVAEWVAGCGWIEIGDQDWQGFVVRALNGAA